MVKPADGGVGGEEGRMMVRAEFCIDRTASRDERRVGDES